MRLGALAVARITESALIVPASELPGVEVVVIAARDPARAQAFAEQHGIARVARSYNDVVNDPDVDAIYNPLPAGLRYRWTLAALERGKHVLAEKPFTANSEQAAEIVAAAAMHDRVCCEALHWRYHPLADRMLAIVRSGTLGTVRHVEASFSAPLEHERDIFFDLALAGGATLELGCYPVHWVRTLVGEEPTVASAVAVERPPGIDVRMRADLEFPSGATARVTCAMDQQLATSLRVEGSDGVLEIDNPLAPHRGHRLEVSLHDGRTFSETVPGGTTYFHQLQAFVEAVRRGTALPTGGADAVNSMRVLDAMYVAAGLAPRT